MHGSVRDAEGRNTISNQPGTKDISNGKQQSTPTAPFAQDSDDGQLQAAQTRGGSAARWIDTCTLESLKSLVYGEHGDQTLRVTDSKRVLAIYAADSS